MNWRGKARAASDDSDPLHGDGASAVSDDLWASALEDLEAGLTPLQVLDRYPEQEAELAPLLQTAYELRAAHWGSMSLAGRVAGRERMRTALMEQKRRKTGFLPPVWRQLGVSLALLVMAGAAFLASPLSPLDLSRQGDAVTPTIGAPVGALEPTSTFTAPPPTASATVSPVPSSTETAQPIVAPVATAEPSETPERLVLSVRTPGVAATPTRAVTPTRQPTLANTATPAPTATAALTDAPTPGQNTGAATQAPAPTLTPTNIPSVTPGRPSPTVTVRPTLSPEPTATETRPSPPTATDTPRPSITPRPTLPPAPSATPQPSATPTRRLPPRLTAQPTATPKATGTPASGNREAMDTIISEARAASQAAQSARDVVRAGLRTRGR